MIEAQALINEARNLVGVPWVHRGRTKSGVDCIGLLILSARNAGLELFKICGISDRRYERRADPTLYKLVDEHCEKSESLIPGALILMKFDLDSHPRHFAIYTESHTVIHAESLKRKQVIEHGLRAHWPRWVNSVWRVPGVKYEEAQAAKTVLSSVL